MHRESGWQFAAVCLTVCLLSNAASAKPVQGGQLYLPVVTYLETELASLLPNHTLFTAYSGAVYIVGEVHNNAGTPLTQVSVLGQLLNAKEQVVAEQQVELYMDPLPPGVTTCFAITFLDPPASWRSYRIAGLGYSRSAGTQPNLTVMNAIGLPNSQDATFRVSGSVRNDQGGPVHCVRPAATLYSNSGQVLDCHVAYVDGYHLAKDQTSSFRIDFDRRDYQAVTGFRVQVNGQIP